MTAFLDIDLNAVVANWRLLTQINGNGETAAVVKADSYGIGAAHVAPVLAKAGCKTFFVAHLAEAIALRALLPAARILTLNGLMPHAAADFVEHGIIPVLSSLHDIALWRAQARGLGRVLPAFLHLETGLHRLALDDQDLSRLAQDPTLLEGIKVETVISHLVNAEDPQDARNQQQLARFLALAPQFSGAKRSLANSAGSFLGPDFQFDLTRPGAALYGVNTSPNQPRKMHPVVRLCAPILQIHELAKGAQVGYGGLWTAPKPSRIATIGVGYGDGLPRSLTNQGTAYFDDKPVALVGRVSMDLTTVDVTGTAAQAGDLLVLLDNRHGVDELGREAGSIGYEILTSLGRRYQRRYIGE